MPKYNVRRIGSDDFDMLIPLMKDCFGMEVNIDYFEWKYVQNPAGSFIGFVAIEAESNEVGGYYGVIPQKFLIHGIEKTVYQSCDTMTHSKHRRQGLFKMLAQECYKFLKENNELFVIGFGGAQSTPGFLKFGWKHVFDFKYYFKPAALCWLSFKGSFNENDFSEHSLGEGNESFFTKDIDNNNVILSNRSAAHIRWRTKNPNYDYKIVSFSEDNNNSGYVVYYVQNKKLILFDFLFFSRTAEKALLWFLSKLVKENHFKGIISFCQENGKQARELRRNSFMSNPFNKGPLSEKTPFIFYADDVVMDKYSSAEQWQITGYDHDAL